jgi:hypothetical protein
MKSLPLTKGYVAYVDDDDYERIAKYKWTAIITGQNIKRVYAYRRAGWDNVNRRWTITVWMHREIAKPPDDMDTDHINHDTLDNRKDNLRHATRTQNLARGRRALGKVGLRGVTLTTSGEKAPYKAQIRGRTIGTFYTKQEAAEAYNAAATEAYGTFATLNLKINGDTK